MPGPVYQIAGLTKSYGSRQVCHIDHLEIYRGEILGIMGPSGAGKSTLLRLLHFLEPPTGGTVRFENWGSNGYGPPPLEVRRRIAMVFQESVLLNATVVANVAYGLRLRGERDAREKLRDALEQVGLAPLARAAATTLSGGEKQRVALARALVVSPQVLLLDEPTANLDPYNVSLIEQLIASINREQGTTIVLVTHNVFQARRLTHRALLLLEGRLVEVGETEQVFARPRDPRTAAFIRGEMVY